jgi:hypothetical protein
MVPVTRPPQRLYYRMTGAGRSLALVRRDPGINLGALPACFSRRARPAPTEIGLSWVRLGNKMIVRDEDFQQHHPVSGMAVDDVIRITLLQNGSETINVRLG